MVNENKEEKALLSFQDKDGNPREIFERDLNDKTRPCLLYTSDAADEP